MATQDVTQRQVELVGEDWHYVGDPGEPAFETGWENYSASPVEQSSWSPCSFRKDPSGLVMLRGLVKNGTTGSGTTTPVFTLPMGYRPQNIAHCIIVSDGESAGSRVKVYASGQVVISIGASSWTDLNGVSFYAET